MTVENETQACLQIKASNSTNIAHGNISHMLSRVNRRMYREDGSYMVRFRIAGSPYQRLMIYTLKPTWRVMSALRLAKEAWLNSTQKEFLAIPKNLRPKWRTFRTQGPLGAANLLYPIEYSDTGTNLITTSLMTTGEFVRSKVATTSGSEMTFTISTNDKAANELGVFDQYALGRPAVPPTPDAISASAVDNMAYHALDEEVQFEILDDLADEGNLPPYDPTTPHGGQYTMHEIALSDQMEWTPWIPCPSGWFVLQAPTVGEDLADSPVCIDVKQTSKGVHFKPYGKTVKQSDGEFKVVRS